MASNQTPNYALNQWELSDSVIMAEFNADNQKVDAALADLNNHVDTSVADAIQRADAALADLTKRFNTSVTNTTNKLNEAAQNLAAVQATIPKIQLGSYVGTGTHGSSSPNTLTFDFTPKLVIINDYVPEEGSTNYTWARFIAVHGTPMCCLDYGTRDSATPQPIYLTWGEKSLTWYSTGSTATRQANAAGMTYHYIAIG